jgi:hypothetical protein
LNVEIFEQNRTFLPEKILEKEYSDLFHNQNVSLDKNSKNRKFVYNKDYLKLDAFGFGMSNCALHLTFSSRDITECRHAYDTLSVFSSIMGALTASSGVIDGTLTDWDSRMRLIEQCTDSRFKDEYVSPYHQLFLPLREPITKADTQQCICIFLINLIVCQFIMIRSMQSINPLNVF